MLRRAALFLSLFLTALAAGQGSVQVTLPPGDYALFASKGPAAGPPADPVLSKGGAATVPLKTGEDHVYVWDRSSDNLAVRSGNDLKKGWQAKAEEFDRLESIAVKVIQGTGPLPAGDVLIKDNDPRHSQIVDANGPAVLFDVKPGNVPITVRFKGPNGETKEVTQVFPVDLQAPKEARILTVAVEPSGGPAAVPTTAGQPSAPAGTAVQPGKPKGQPANPAGIVFGWLIGLAIAAAILYGALLYARKNSDAVSSKLEQLGVQIPKPGDQGLSSATPVAPEPIRPQPVEKIVLPDAGITPLAEPLVASAPAVSVTQPSLIADGGVAIPLPEGETVVGREPGLGLSLTAETTVSRRHASLIRSGNEVTVSDLGSSNGTFVNGAQLQSPVVLRSGDSVQFGSARFQYRT